MRLNINIIFTSRALPTTADDDPRDQNRKLSMNRITAGLYLVYKISNFLEGASIKYVIIVKKY